MEMVFRSKTTWRNLEPSFSRTLFCFNATIKDPGGNDVETESLKR